MERYSIVDTTLLKAIAALIQFAKDFNNSFAEQNIHLKVLMSGEVFPHLEQRVLENPLKSVLGKVYLLWQPKPLLRLIAYRFYHYLTNHGIINTRVVPQPNWNQYEDVLEKVWNPYFGKFVSNGRGVREHTFPYLLRHTQMRPRQLIVLCNQVAALAKESGTFPRMSDEHLVEGVRATEETLANEIINSYGENFENMNRVLNSMLGCPMHFRPRELDSRAWGIKKEWKLMEQLGEYSAEAYRYVLAELGIVGVVTKSTNQFFQAEFEYSTRDRLHLGNDDDCVIHPMFYKRLRVQLNSEKHVLPFSPSSFGGEYLE